ncbi:MAG TPA: hypothetical protein VF201_14310 [Nitrolancea sp.]
MAIVRVVIPDKLAGALQSGELSPGQVRELIELEAAALGLSFAQAVDAVQQQSLPWSPLSADLSFLVSMLSDEASPAE